MHAKLARGIRGRSDDPARIETAHRDDEGLVLEFRIEQDFDGGVERVEVEMNDLSQRN